MENQIDKLLDELSIPRYSHDELSREMPRDERVLNALLRYKALREIMPVTDAKQRAAVTHNA